MDRREKLVGTYKDALKGRAICIHSALSGRASYFGGEPGAVAKFWFGKPAHAELVALHCLEDCSPIGPEENQWIDLPPAAMVDKIKAVAAELGAQWQTEEQVERVAEITAAEIARRLEKMRTSGGLKQINSEYRIYRLTETAKGGKAMSYNAFIDRYRRYVVTAVARQ